MQKYIWNTLVAGFFLLLAGCQSSTMDGGANLFTPYPTSRTLAQSVQDALSRSEDPVIAHVHVETNQNRVILSGYVKKIRQSDIAEQIAHKVPGVQTVENNVIVRQ